MSVASTHTLTLSFLASTQNSNHVIYKQRTIFPTGQPDAQGNSSDCVAMYTSTGMWDDVDCSTRNGYVCEKNGTLSSATMCLDYVTFL